MPFTFESKTGIA